MNAVIVDDEHVNLFILERMLEKLNCSAKGFQNVHEAISYISDVANDVDLVITDHKMQEMDGLAFSQEVKNINPSLPVYMLTGRMDLVDDITPSSLSAIYAKPIEIEVLKNIVATTNI